MDDRERSTDWNPDDVDREKADVERSLLEDEATGEVPVERRGPAHGGRGDHADRGERGGHGGHGHDGRGTGGHAGRGDHGDGGHGGMHAGHERLFRRRFFVSFALSIPVLLYSETLQSLVGFSVPTVPGSEWLSPVFGGVVFAYGGVPFLRMADALVAGSTG